MREYLEIGLYVKTADEPAPDRHDVVNDVPNTSSLCQSDRLGIEGSDSLMVSPYRGGSQFRQFSAPHISYDLVLVSLCPLLVILAVALVVGFGPGRPILTFVSSILVIPFYVGTWVLSSPLIGSGNNTSPASMASAVGGCTTDSEFGVDCGDLAHAAHLQSGLCEAGFFCTLLNKSWFSSVGLARFANRDNAEAASGRALSSRSVDFVEFAQRLTDKTVRACLVDRSHLRKDLLPWAAALFAVFSGSLCLRLTGTTFAGKTALTTERDGVLVFGWHQSRITQSGIDSKAEMVTV